ncbi:hypothetical protein FRB95_009340 [Tulasnella sp. JGI-2019a]|nr:hypothetical protein FRB95_009340 [Tulasnella sp. JGI-2019a]
MPSAPQRLALPESTPAPLLFATTALDYLPSTIQGTLSGPGPAGVIVNVVGAPTLGPMAALPTFTALTKGSIPIQSAMARTPAPLRNAMAGPSSFGSRPWVIRSVAFSARYTSNNFDNDKDEGGKNEGAASRTFLRPQDDPSWAIVDTGEEDMPVMEEAAPIMVPLVTPIIKQEEDEDGALGGLRAWAPTENDIGVMAGTLAVANLNETPQAVALGGPYVPAAHVDVDEGED